MGWSDNGIISQAELDAAARFTSDVLTVPNRATAGYIFFGVEASPGYPDSALLDGNPTNQITNFLQQAGTLMRDSEFIVIGVSTAELTAGMSGPRVDTGVRSVMAVDFSDFLRSLTQRRQADNQQRHQGGGGAEDSNGRTGHRNRH